MRQRRAQRRRHAVAQAAAFVLAEDLIELRRRQIKILLALGAAVGQHPILAFERFGDLGVDARHRHRLFIPLRFQFFFQRGSFLFVNLAPIGAPLGDVVC